jgi:hypothetical protein
MLHTKCLLEIRSWDNSRSIQSSGLRALAPGLKAKAESLATKMQFCVVNIPIRRYAHVISIVTDPLYLEERFNAFRGHAGRQGHDLS